MMAATTRKRSDTELPRYNRKFSLGRSNSPQTLPLDSSIPPVPFPGAAVRNTHRRSRSVTNAINSSRPSQDSTVAAPDPDTVYYRNAEARNRLKQYLATPQRFDEVLTYGFGPEPSSSIQDVQNHRSVSPNLRQNTRSPSSDVPELEDHRSFNASETGTESPATPADPEFAWRASKYNRVSIFGGLDTDALPSFELDLKYIAEAPEPEPRRSFLPPSPPPFNREMTLRMTLTRPDLRANEEEMYGHSRPVSKVETISYSPVATPVDRATDPRAMSTIDGDFLFPEKSYEPSQIIKRTFMPNSTAGLSRLFKKLRRN